MISQLATPQLGEDVQYGVLNRENRDLFLLGRPYRLYDQGKGIGGYRKFTDPNLMQGGFFLCMLNDNFRQGINVTVKVSAIIETTTYEDKVYTDEVIEPRYEKRLMKEPIVTTSTIPVAGL